MNDDNENTKENKLFDENIVFIYFLSQFSILCHHCRKIYSDQISMDQISKFQTPTNKHLVVKKSTWLGI